MGILYTIHTHMISVYVLYMYDVFIYRYVVYIHVVITILLQQVQILEQKVLSESGRKWKMLDQLVCFLPKFLPYSQSAKFHEQGRCGSILQEGPPFCFVHVPLVVGEGSLAPDLNQQPGHFKMAATESEL